MPTAHPEAREGHRGHSMQMAGEQTLKQLLGIHQGRARASAPETSLSTTFLGLVNDISPGESEHLSLSSKHSHFFPMIDFGNSKYTDGNC